MTTPTRRAPTATHLIFLLIPCLISTHLELWAGDSPALAIGSRKQLFIDHRFIESSEGIELVFNPPHQTGEKLVVADAPWEEGWHIGSYNSVLKEEGPDGWRIRLWYDIREGNGMLGEGMLAVAYAESDDGIRFTKPVQGLVEWNGSKENNLVFPTDLSKMLVGGGSVFRDENPRTPHAERYKSWSKLYRTPGTRRGENRVWYSADGLHWKLYDQELTGLREADTQPTWFWDARIGRYRGYSREWEELDGERRTRMAGHNESDNMLDWDSFSIIFQADQQDLSMASDLEQHRRARNPTVENAPRVPGAPMDFYGPGVFQYSEAPDVYFALLSAFYHWTMKDDGKAWPDTADVQLAVSRDGRSFQRLGGRQPFLRLGPEGSFYSKWLWACPRPVRVGDELWFYDAGSNQDHSDRAGPSGHKPQAALTRAILRLDGFVSAAAAYTGGSLTTPPLIFDGSHLELNLDTSAGGSARVEMQDAPGKPLAGYRLGEADELNGNSVKMRVSWRGGADVSALSGKPVKLHFKLRSYKLYAFQFVK